MTTTINETKQIQDLIAKALKTNRSVEEEEKILNEPFNYLNEVKGKNIRDTLIDSFQTWLDVPPNTLHQVKMIIHKLHNASLLIDDIEDYSELRRGRPAAHKIYGEPQTINCGNYVYFQALDMCRKLNNLNAIGVFAEEMLCLHRGQGLDLFWRDRTECPTLVDYMRMVIDKTGGLFRMAIRLLQVCSKKKMDFTHLANLMGLFFQIRDDYANLKMTEYHQNKNFCEDITEGKFSFPIIFCILYGELYQHLMNQSNKTKDHIQQQKLYHETIAEQLIQYVNHNYSNNPTYGQNPVNDLLTPAVSVSSSQRFFFSPRESLRIGDNSGPRSTPSLTSSSSANQSRGSLLHNSPHMDIKTFVSSSSPVRQHSQDASSHTMSHPNANANANADMSSNSNSASTNTSITDSPKLSALKLHPLFVPVASSERILTLPSSSCTCGDIGSYGLRILNILKQRTDNVSLKQYVVSLLEESGSFDFTKRMLYFLKQEMLHQIQLAGGNAKLILIINALSKDVVDAENTGTESDTKSKSPLHPHKMEKATQDPDPSTTPTVATTHASLPSGSSTSKQTQ